MEHARALIHEPLASHFDVQSRLVSLFEAMGMAPVAESPTESGTADVYMPLLRAVIEAKRRGSLDPDADGSIGDESQVDQLGRYVREKALEQISALQSAGDSGDARSAATGRVTGWKGILTDGQHYYLYRFNEHGDRLEVAPEYRNFESDAPEDLWDWLERRLGDRPEKRPLPDSRESLAGLFGRYAERLGRVHRRVGDRRGAQTKLSLWRNMVRGSGFDIGEAEVDLFRNHTLLVHAAEAVIASLNGDTRPGTEIMADGFASWPQDRLANRAPNSVEGSNLTNDIFAAVREYDWRSRGRDVLREVYEALIEREHRQAFGEYYTPDWLAAAVVEEVLDDDWCERAIAAALNAGDEPLRGIGVLDPACGSGTFLYQSARRILNSPAMRKQRLRPAQQSAVVLKLVNGIDIHPIAVSIARATLLRALPEVSGLASLQLNVYQGDSLAIPWEGGWVRYVADDGAPYLGLERQDKDQIPIPEEFANSNGFGVQLERLVRSAQTGDRFPDGVGIGLSRPCALALRRTHEVLTQVCRTEGDSVWVWYLTNQIAPYSLRKRGVDRVVANPPWVVMNKIQVEERKRTLESLACEMGIAPGGKNASSFDIAALFVKRCRELYLHDGGSAPAAGWVLKRAAMTTMPWALVRDSEHEHNAEYWDLSRVRRQPFTGAKSCVWIQRGRNKAPTTMVLVNADESALLPTDDWAAGREKTNWRSEPGWFAEIESDYADGETFAFRNGASLRPFCLSLVGELRASSTAGHVEVTTAPSRQKPWHDVPVQSGIVPEHYVRPAVVGSIDLLQFTVRRKLSQAIVPLTRDGELDVDGDARGDIDNAFFRHLDAIYQERRGKGRNTPKTLWGRINYNDALMKQVNEARLAGGRGRVKVLYNESGALVRAARVDTGTLANVNCYYFAAPSEDHAAYLTALLNAPALQLAYRRSQESDRDYLLHIWRKVPIPEFDERDGLHVELSELCIEAEEAAVKLAKMLSDSDGQIAASNRIRTELCRSGIADRLDDAVRRLMPDHTVAEYTDDVPHPWRSARGT